MINETLLRKYAHLAIKSGVNIQKGQLLVIDAPIHCGEFARLCAEEAYRLGASEVEVVWSDEVLKRLTLLNQTEEALKDFPEWEVMRKKRQVEKNCAFLHLDSKIPEMLNGCEASKIQTMAIARQTAMKPYQNYTSAGHGQWSIVAIPNPEWACKVFPECSKEEAVDRLWDAILKTVYLTEDNDVVEEWVKHSQKIQKHCQILNAMNLKSLHFKNSLGTNLEIELVNDHIWAGGSEDSTKGIPFNPNMPTEEVFTMPHRLGVNGKVVSTKPLNYQGQLIEDFEIDFKAGKAISCKAKTNQESLQALIDLDEGSAYLGEVALISHNSPISQSQILYYDTLFDENASCHLALGRAYPMNIKGGPSMSDEELKEKGCNLSLTHVDFMFGSEDMEIIGIDQNKDTKEIFKNGNFVF